MSRSLIVCFNYYDDHDMLWVSLRFPCCGSVKLLYPHILASILPAVHHHQSCLSMTIKQNPHTKFYEMCFLKCLHLKYQSSNTLSYLLKGQKLYVCQTPNTDTQSDLWYSIPQNPF